MTTIRKLSIRILNAVIRLAAPATQDWAAAMLRELDFIENDWTALRWASGSARILFTHQDLPLANLTEIPRAAQRLKRKVWRRTLVGYVTTLGEIAAFGWFSFHASTQLQRVGCYCIMAAMLYLAYQLFAGRSRAAPLEVNLSDSAIYYRAELERQRDFFRGSSLWSRMVFLIPGPILLGVGAVIAYPDRIRTNATILVMFIGLCIVGIPRSLRESRKYQRQIAELDAVRESPLRGG
jgi:hypothetical protein